MKKLYFILLLSCFYAYSQKEELRFRMLYDKYTIEGENNIPQDSVAFPIFHQFVYEKGKEALSYDAYTDASSYNSCKLHLITKNNNATLFVDDSTLNLKFFDSKYKIEVNKKDVYFLEKQYYNFLKTKILEQKDISEILDFLDDCLGDYFLLEDLFLVSSKSKYRFNYKILKAVLVTQKQQSDGFEKWLVFYIYDEKGIVSITKKAYKKGENYADISFFKERLSTNPNSFSFSITEANVKSMEETQKTISLDNSFEKTHLKSTNMGNNTVTFIKKSSTFEDVTF